ncbi:hypothetical protein FPZ24_04685 [Sphingomonas panacisoli]|uniref:Peptidase A2 domain-containing protein n=1 Tax=Sphingomonas panacisoli TaxID=1813879 RepID=A0A5B8LG33_9SPHN|nr:retropepsin-like aspartic protease [Sphingomonas panacisoli]QDZ06859.1 hypothetical protein FPZ24_04685 [Sphingomonas panacisoli]
MPVRTPLLLLAALAAAPTQPNVYGPPPAAGTAERLAYDAELGGEKEDAAIEAWLATHLDAPARQRALLWHRLCNDFGVRVGGIRRVTACANAVKLTGDSEDKSDFDIATAFRDTPATTARGQTTVSLVANPLGSRSAEVTVEGTALQWIVDTGAEITTLPASTAAKIGVQFVAGTADVGTSVGSVKGKLGVIDTATIGGVTIRHIQVLVLPDEMLRLAKDYVIPGILGLPAIAATGRIAWLDGGTRLALGMDAPKPSGKVDRVYWHESGLGIPLKTALGTAGAQFDSGANATSLRQPGLALLTKQQIDSATERNGTLGGAGGYISVKQRVLPKFSYTLAGAALESQKVTIEENADSAGRVGSDILPQLKVLTIDFATMTLAAEPSSAR